MINPPEFMGPVTEAQLAQWLASAELGDATAQFLLARVHEGAAKGIEPNLPKAISWYFKAASQGHVGAQLNLGLLLLDGMEKAGAKRNPAQAFSWLSKAANAGSAAAQHRLGAMLLEGDGTNKDASLGIAWLERAATARNADAQFALGYRLGTGQDVAPDIVRAIDLLLQATRQDHAKAMSTLAMLVRDGTGFSEPDERVAARLYNRAVAKHTDYDAANQLGILYARGRGVERDLPRAQTLFEYAISGGNDLAMYNLALLILNRDQQAELPTVAMWAHLAHKHCPDGAGIDKLLQVLGNIATPEQNAEGARRAGEWKRLSTGISVVTVSGGMSEAEVKANMIEALGDAAEPYFVIQKDAADEFADL